MKRHFEIELASARDAVLTMGEQVEQALAHAVKGLQERDTTRFELAFGFKRRVDQMRSVLEEHCLKLLALQSPFTSDLRLILGINRLNRDLAQVGALSAEIARHGFHILLETKARMPDDLMSMTDEVSTMMHEALLAFMKSEVRLARHVLTRDYIVDSWKNQIIEDQLAAIKAEPLNARRCVELIAIARHLECIGDHATNMAEASIAVIAGTDIRHHRTESSHLGGNLAAPS